jgi:hypothetical protein
VSTPQNPPPPQKFLTVKNKKVLAVTCAFLFFLPLVCMVGTIAWDFSHPAPREKFTPAPTSDIESLLLEAAALCSRSFSASLAEGSAQAPAATLISHGLDVWDFISGYFPSIAEAGSAAEVKTLVCIKETRLKVGEYVPIRTPDSPVIPLPTSLGAGYQIEWDVRLVRYPSGEVLAAERFLGDPPPLYGAGVEIGSDPRPVVEAWLALALGK